VCHGCISRGTQVDLGWRWLAGISLQILAPFFGKGWVGVNETMKPMPSDCQDGSRLAGQTDGCRDNRMNACRYLFLISLCIGSSIAAESKAARPPNVVLIMADDKEYPSGPKC
jgi:hypothetical protein